MAAPKFQPDLSIPACGEPGVTLVITEPKTNACRERKLTDLPEVGDIIYTPTQMYMSHGVDDICGGKATVTKVEFNGGYYAISVKEVPNRWNWDYLSLQQRKLKDEFGDNWAYPDPDNHPDANSWE